MTTPTPRTAMTSDDMPPGLLSEDDLRRAWNQQADEPNQWDSLGSDEQLAWAQVLAIKADRHATALKAEPEGKQPTEQDLYDLAAEFDGDPVPAMRRALEVWGNPLQGAPAPGENHATPPAPELVDVERLMPVSERLRIVKAGIRAGYTLGHHHTVEGGWGDPDEVADDIAQETLDDLPAPQAGEVEA